MDSAALSYAGEQSLRRLGRLGKSLVLWLFELLALATSFGIALAAYTAWQSRDDPAMTGFLQRFTDVPIWIGAVALMAILNFVQSGYVVTSLAARLLCMSRLPRLYPVILSCLVVLHIWVIRLMDHGNWALSISFPLFVVWGSVSAFVISWFSVDLQNSRLRVVGAGTVNSAEDLSSGAKARNSIEPFRHD